MMARTWVCCASVCILAAVSGCNGTPVPQDSGPQDVNIDVPGTDGGILSSHFFDPFPAPFDMTTSMPGSVQVSLSTEALGELGYAYTSTPSANAVDFVDGWALDFDHYLVVIGSVTIAAQGADPTMRNVVGATLAHRVGPWLVDGHRHGSISGAGGAPETATPLFVFTGPDGGGSFDTAAQYAFSFENARATRDMINVNVPMRDQAIAEQMVTNGWTHYVSGTATYQGRASTASVDPTFQRYPTTVHFVWGWAATTRYINCHNPEIGNMDAPANRGVRPSATGAVRAQLTLHTDHSFWDEGQVHGTPLRFDAFAARASNFGMTMMPHELRLSDFVGVPPAALVDRMSMPVLDRGAQTTGYTPDTGIPPVYSANGATGIADLRDWFAYLTSSQGHLNSDGLCFVMPVGPFSY